MGGIIILAGILVPTLLFADYQTLYPTDVDFYGIVRAIGFVDDYIKVFKKKRRTSREI